MNGVSTKEIGCACPLPTEHRGFNTRWISLAVEFGLLPVAVGWLVPPVWWVPSLWVIAAVAWWRLRRETGVAPHGLWRPVVWDEARGEVTHILWRYAGSVVVLVTLVATWMPDRLFDFPRQRPWLWLAIIVLYPLLSVYAQELLYRKFFFHRYGGLFTRNWQMVAASAVAFAWMHIIFRNEWAIGMTLIGGWLFADTYRRTGSLRLVCLEHALYGNLVFTVGLGKFIFHGAVKT